MTIKSIREHFAKRFNKNATNISVDVSYPKECVHCGYGRKEVGTAHLKNVRNSIDNNDNSIGNNNDNSIGNNNDNSIDSNNDNYNDSLEEQSEIVTFDYWTGCLTYSDELSYE